MNKVETFYGLIESTADALRVLELCRLGRLGRVQRRLHERERRLIRSGSVFVFDESESGIRRWTDGRLWSPSRILGNFLIYRELERRPAGPIADGREEMVGGGGDKSMAASVTRVMDRISSSSGGAGGSYSDSSWLTAPVLPEIGQGICSASAAAVPSSSAAAAAAAVSPPSATTAAAAPWSFEGGGGGTSGSSLGASPLPVMGSSLLSSATVAPSSDRFSSPPSPPIFVVDPRQLWSSSGTTTTTTPQIRGPPVVGPAKRTRSLSDASSLASPLGPAPSPMAAAASFIGPNAVRLLQSKKLQGSGPPGSLRYTFKPDGLIKKTLSAKIDGRTQHLICYFSEADFVRAHGGGSRLGGATSAAATATSLMAELRRTPLPDDLILQQHFRKQPTLHSQSVLEPPATVDRSFSAATVGTGLCPSSGSSSGSSSAGSGAPSAAALPGPMQRHRRHSVNWTGAGRPVQIYPRLEGGLNNGNGSLMAMARGGRAGIGAGSMGSPLDGTCESGMDEWPLSSLALSQAQLSAPASASASPSSVFPSLPPDSSHLMDSTSSGVPPYTATIMDECIKMVLGDQSTSFLLMGDPSMLGSGNPAALGLAPSSDDPPLPIIDRPGSAFD